MKPQTRRALTSGKKVRCGQCRGVASNPFVTCDRGCTNGSVLVPLRHMMERGMAEKAS